MPTKQPSKKRLQPMTLTIRAHTADEIRALQELQSLTGERTMSGAIFQAAKELPALQKRIETTEQANREARKQINAQNEILHFMYSAQEQVSSYGKKNFKGAKYPEQDMFDDDDDFN